MPAIVKQRLRSAAARLPRLARLLRRCDGAAAVEFAIVAAPFIALVLAVVQVGLIIYANQSLQTVAATASRLILTGQAQTQKMGAGDFGKAVCSDAGMALFACSGLMVDVRTYTSLSGGDTSMPTLTYDSQGNVTNAWQYNPGGPGDFIIMRLMYRWPVFLGPLGLNLSNLPDGHRLLMATVAFKNEPYQ